MNDVSRKAYAAAKARGDARMQGPRAISARFDAGRNRVIIKLTTGLELGFAPQDVEGLHQAKADDLKAIQIEAFGLGIHFPTLDVDIYVPALLEGHLGSERWMAARRSSGDKPDQAGGKARRIAAPQTL
jgi:hypothetical protein